MNNVLSRKDIQRPWGLGLLRDPFFDDFFATLPQQSVYKFNPSCDIEETQTAFKVQFDVPGVKREDIHVEVQNNQLIVSGHRSEETEKTEGKTHLKERFTGSFSRSFTLPVQVDSENIEATYKEGVLLINIPKSDVVKPKKIKVA